MSNTSSRSELVHRNFLAFQEKLPGLLVNHAGKFAVMHASEVIELLDTFADAVRFGQHVFGEDFTVQEVTHFKHSLGFQTHAFGDVR